MKSVNEQPNVGKWMPMEHYVLLLIMQSYFGVKEFTLSSLLQESVSSISEVYNAVVQVAMHYGIPVSLAVKSDTQINAKIMQCVKEFELIQKCGFVNILP